MADPQAPQEVADFFLHQRATNLAFVLNETEDPLSIRVTPYSIESGLLTHLALLIPRGAVSKVVPTGDRVEYKGLTHLAVHLQFEGDAGELINSVYLQLVQGHQHHIEQNSNLSTDTTAARGTVGPMRDWCGWNWPTTPPTITPPP